MSMCTCGHHDRSHVIEWKDPEPERGRCEVPYCECRRFEWVNEDVRVER